VESVPGHAHLRRARPQGLRGDHLDQHVSAQGAPREITHKLTATLDAALADPSLRERLDQAGIITPRATGPEFLEKYLKLEIDKWAEILRSNKDAD
jgi:tripartite-type tricarboxylate transporter receptor subunit TctC